MGAGVSELLYGSLLFSCSPPPTPPHPPGLLLGVGVSELWHRRQLGGLLMGRGNSPALRACLPCRQEHCMGEGSWVGVGSDPSFELTCAASSPPHVNWERKMLLMVPCLDPPAVNARINVFSYVAVCSPFSVL